MKNYELIRIGSNYLKDNKIPSHLLDSEILLAKVLKKSKEKILIDFDKNVSEKNILAYKKYLIRRSNCEPIAYILEEKEFWSKKFIVSKDTLIPRPETELLVEAILKIFLKKKITILDIGTGTGCILISLLSSLKQSYGIGVDVSKKALEIAKKNALRHKINNRSKLLNKSFEDIINKKFDLIVSNPPYIKREDMKILSDDIKKYEPRIALEGGNDGLDLIRKVIYKSKNILKIKGMLALEIGNEQIKKVSKILFDNDFRVLKVIKDYKKNVRCVLASNN